MATPGDDLFTGRPPVLKMKEDRLQINMVYMLRLDFLEEDLIFCHVPNGADRTPAQGAKLKAMGLLPGMSDLAFWWPHANPESPWESGIIEIKTEDPGSFLSDDQRDVRRRANAMNGRFAVARKYETLRDQLVAWGVKCQYRVHLT